MLGMLFVVGGILLGSAATGYDGNCYGFTDGVSGCSFEDYMSIQIQWLFILMIPAAVVVSVVAILNLILSQLSKI
ncbi:MAG: hypothetical protein DWQ07_07875 [Chloroflexi bacterium]|nr:MAG: hypothetical protein DWQ07_07875 [Chloroflexota bacterium]MBL1197044.1 hypothetical protein [Chloroflexota bacterium]